MEMRQVNLKEIFGTNGLIHFYGDDPTCKCDMCRRTNEAAAEIAKDLANDIDAQIIEDFRRMKELLK